MDEFGLINIACPDLSGNGRFYSLSRINFGKPEIGRMLSPDNYVQAPDFTQNFNRYSYCFNNPFKFTDPSGNNQVADMYHGYYPGSGGGDGDGRNFVTGWGNTNLSRHLGDHLNGFYSGGQGMFDGANSRANFYFGWAIPYYRGETKTSFSDYYSNGGKISSVTVDGPITVQFPGENGGTYTIEGEDGGGATGDGLPDYMQVKGTSGFGLSFEVAFPDWVIGDLTDYNGVGIDFGILRDKDGFGFYATTKSTKKSSFALSASLEGFGASQRLASSNINLTRSYLKGPGYETSFGAWIFGGAYGVSNAADYNRHSTYHVFSGSIGFGLDMGFVNWNTYTYLSGK